MAAQYAVGYPPSLQPGPESYPFGRFNTSVANYTGPTFSEVYYDYYDIGGYMWELKHACAAVIGPGFDKWNFLVAECVMHNLNEQARTHTDSYSYMLTLWPAIVSLFASLGPDASDAAYDNFLWAILLSMTSGAMAGFQKPPKIPHRIKTHRLTEARELCTLGESAYKGDEIKIGRFSARRRHCSKKFSRSQWATLTAGFAIWFGFAGSYLFGLRWSFLYATRFVLSFAHASLWFWLAFLPAFLEAVARVYANNIDLYEPSRSDEAASRSVQRRTTGLIAGLQTFIPLELVGSTKSAEAVISPQLEYHLVNFGAGHNLVAGLRTWRRIIANQLRGRSYRLLVHPYSVSFAPASYQSAIPFVRFTLLIVGSIMQSIFTLYPPELVIVQSALLALMTASPRILWPHYWMRDRRGADLVVFYNRPLTDDLDGMTF